MQLVKRFKDVERFWLPWSFDYRGRVYPIPSFLTPQDTDFGKSLLRFADEAVIGNDSKARHWLSFQVATSYGLDKATIQDRIDWVSINEDLITRVAVDPIGNLSDWCDVEEPWQFLAACDEFYHCFILYDRHTTGLPVAVDATCSGLQILAGLARDQSTAKLVNVLPGEAPQDAYRAVAEVAKTHLPENLAALLDRRVTKRTVMTIPYNAKPFSNRQYIRAALKEKEAEFTNDDLKAITKAVIDAMNEVVPGPMAVMRWINQEISNLLKEGVEEISWTTPSGFVVRQRLMKPKLVVVKLKLMGTCKLVVGDGHTDEIDVNRHKAATAPNLIYSLDASLLHLSFANFELPFTVIHDSVLCRATDMDELNRRVRHTYKKLFAETDFLNDFSKQIGASTPPPIIGDFDPSVVGDSTYFFC
jgi:DNA-directed RNA polymerase